MKEYSCTFARLTMNHGLTTRINNAQWIYQKGVDERKRQEKKSETGTKSLKEDQDKKKYKIQAGIEVGVMVQQPTQNINLFQTYITFYQRKFTRLYRGETLPTYSVVSKSLMKDINNIELKYNGIKNG